MVNLFAAAVALRIAVVEFDRPFENDDSVVVLGPDSSIQIVAAY